MANIRPLNEDLQKAAIEQLGEIPTRIPDDLAALKQWIEQQPHLRANTDDQFLIAFLRGCKYSLAKAKAKLDMYFTLKSSFAKEIGSIDVDNKNFRDIIHMGLFVLLPTPLPDNGPRIVLMRHSAFDPDACNIHDVLKVSSILLELLLLEDDYANVNGVAVIHDFENITLHHFMLWTPVLMKKMIIFFEEAVPLRIKSLHFINTPSGFETFYHMIRPLVSEKLQNRLFVHGTKIDSMYPEVPLKYLPQEYGGNNGAIQEILRVWEKKLDEYREYFIKAATYGTDEKLRLGKAFNFDSVFGIEGSFRKLDVD